MERAQIRRDARVGDPFLRQQARGKARPRAMHVDLAVFDDVRHPGLRSRSVDLQGGHDEDVVVICEADVEPGLHAEAGRVYEIGVIFACRDQDDRRDSGAAGLTPPWSGRLDGLGVTPQTGGFYNPCGRPPPRINAPPPRPPPPGGPPGWGFPAPPSPGTSGPLTPGPPPPPAPA